MRRLFPRSALAAATAILLSTLAGCGGTVAGAQHDSGDSSVSDAPVAQEAGACPANPGGASCSEEGASCNGPTGCTSCGVGLWDEESVSCVCSGGMWSCAVPGACIAGHGSFTDDKCTHASVADGGVEGGLPTEGGTLEASCTTDAAPPPDGSAACAGFTPGACGSTCSPEGLVCRYAPTYLTGTCCGGTWSCAGI